MKQKIKKLICKLIGHKPKEYIKLGQINAICSRCGIKLEAI